MTSNQIKWPSNPRIFQTNAWTRLNYLSHKANEEITLQNLPKEVIQKGLKGFDAMWLMGVWKRSLESRKIALNHPDLQGEYRSALKDFKPEDVVGSPYAVFEYEVDPHLGGDEGLKAFRETLNEESLLLVLDYVPNHVAIDSPWTKAHPDMFVQGTQEDMKKQPHDYFEVNGNYIAHGKDPYFLPWTDTAQINAFSELTRQKTIETLLKIAEQCDGIRCDMAMLLVNEVFQKTWNEKAGEPLKKEFWEEIIPAIKMEFPEFKFIAEVYWDMEWRLMQQGFDFCYDKSLYERVVHDDAKSVNAHLRAELGYQRKLLRFIENHDEKRAIRVFGEKRSLAAAVLTFTLPGARLIHEGQTRGHEIKLPVQLGRRPAEKDNMDLMHFYRHLLASAPGKNFSEGNWSLCRIEPVGSDFSSGNLIAHEWAKENKYNKLIVVNFSPYPSKGHVRSNFIKFGFEKWNFIDSLNKMAYTYNGANLDRFGLYVELDPWNSHIFDISRTSD